MKNQAELSNLLTGLALLVRNMPDDQFAQLVRGNPLVSSLSSKKPSSAKKKGGAMKSSPPPCPTVSDIAILSKLRSATTRDDGARILHDAFPDKGGLVEFAKHLDLPVQKKDKTDRIRDKVLEFTVGRRLDSEAIRGGYTAK